MEQLTLQRKGLDSVLATMNSLPNSRGKALAYTALQKGRMYIGEVLRELGKEYPYEATKEATTAEGIQDAVDKADADTPVLINTGNEIIDINKLRDILEKELDSFVVTIGALPKSVDLMKKFVQDTNIAEAYRSLKESRMWLGIRLGELRDNVTK